jgi:hypothetical protein
MALPSFLFSIFNRPPFFAAIMGKTSWDNHLDFKVLKRLIDKLEIS